MSRIILSAVFSFFFMYSSLSYGACGGWDGCVSGGALIPTICDDNAPGPAFGGNGRITINRNVMASFSPSHRKFIYWHECGHVVLGHQSNSASNEMDADCIAFQFLTSTYNLRPDEIVQIAREMSQMPGDWTHLPGPARVNHLLSCGGAPICRNVTLPEQYMDMDVILQPQQIPCQHCGCNYFGYCSCMHPFDVINQPVQVPVTRTRMVTRQVCD